ncbi:MAG: Proline iminopeptidase [Burkholderiaceae bacterium]|nr:MAG: Proline iminopeptidase [Burkholderiaceae bacterium]
MVYSKFCPSLYPERIPYHTEWVPVTGGHTLWLQQIGSPQGIPALVLHGGPGSGCAPLLAQFFDPERYRVICMDQRGAGLSRPRGATAHNSTADLLSDLRQLRNHLEIDRWLVVGGSWGATLALAHALDCPDAVSALLLRGVFLARQIDIDAFFEGSGPNGKRYWEPEREMAAHWRCTLVECLRRRLRSPHLDDSLQTVRRWWRWEQQMDGMSADKELHADLLVALLYRYRVQSHYLAHCCWLDDPPLQQRCSRLPPVPVRILHGTRDAVCPPEGAKLLHDHIAHSELHWVEAAGHAPTHPAMAGAMRQALDVYAKQETFAIQRAP